MERVEISALLFTIADLQNLSTLVHPVQVNHENTRSGRKTSVQVVRMFPCQGLRKLRPHKDPILNPCEYYPHILRNGILLVP